MILNYTSILIILTLVMDFQLVAYSIAILFFLFNYMLFSDLEEQKINYISNSFIGYYIQSFLIVLKVHFVLLLLAIVLFFLEVNITSISFGPLFLLSVFFYYVDYILVVIHLIILVYLCVIYWKKKEGIFKYI